MRQKVIHINFAFHEDGLQVFIIWFFTQKIIKISYMNYNSHDQNLPKTLFLEMWKRNSNLKFLVSFGTNQNVYTHLKMQTKLFMFRILIIRPSFICWWKCFPSLLPSPVCLNNILAPTQIVSQCLISRVHWSDLCCVHFMGTVNSIFIYYPSILIFIHFLSAFFKIINIIIIYIYVNKHHLHKR